MSQSGAELIRIERIQQIHVLQFDAVHDVGHAHELIQAAIGYAAHADSLDEYGVDLAVDELPAWPEGWPFLPGPSTKRELIKAGALIAAAIDEMIAEENR